MATSPAEAADLVGEEVGPGGGGEPLAPAQTDWLLNRLTVSGPAGEVARFRASSRGTNAAPWHLDLDEEEARLFAPMATGGADARVLARELREIIAARHDRVLAGWSGPGTCPLDLHRLVPIPRAILQLGEYDQAARRWLWAHWGTTQPLRQVRVWKGRGTSACAVRPGSPTRSCPRTGPRGKRSGACGGTGRNWCSMSGPTTASTDPAGTDAPEQVAPPDPLWDDWAELAQGSVGAADGMPAEGAPPRIPNSPELHLPGFDGPMDLLLDLAERQRIDLGRISVLQLAEQFLAEMERLQLHVTLERRADWLVMATRLLLLRSRLLFPPSPEAGAEAAQDTAREAGRLDEMVFVRAAAAWLDRRPQLGRDVFVRPHGPSPRAASYMALMEACLFVLRGPEGQPGVAEAVYRPAPPLLFRVDEAIARIQSLLAGQREEVAFELCLPAVKTDDPLRELKARSAVASSLVAVLELARVGEVTASQAERDAPILLCLPT